MVDDHYKKKIKIVQNTCEMLKTFLPQIVEAEDVPEIITHDQS